MLRPQIIEAVPSKTVRVAQAAFLKGHRYLRLANELGALFTDILFSDLFPTHGQPALAPWRLALVSILQFAEGLSDRQAADAVRSLRRKHLTHETDLSRDRSWRLHRLRWHLFGVQRREVLHQQPVDEDVAFASRHPRPHRSS